MTIADIVGKHIVLTAEPLQMTLEEHYREEELIQQALSVPKIIIPAVDSLLGEEVPGYEGVYWYALLNDPTPCGIIKSYGGVSIPSVTHIPTNSVSSYRKVWKVINGVKTPVWEIHQKDLTSSHEPYGDEKL